MMMEQIEIIKETYTGFVELEKHNQYYVAGLIKGMLSRSNNKDKSVKPDQKKQVN